jgi:ABC-type hemin transport system substrate-binding protein
MEALRTDWLEFVFPGAIEPQRVVSLVPSVTESIFDLGWGERLVGLTDFCRYPENGVAGLPRVGGTKTPRVPEILDLSPDLVIANREENDQTAVEALLSAGIPTWITFPQTVNESIALLYALARLFRSPAAIQRVKTLETAVEWNQAAAAGGEGFIYFCPIWQGETEDDGIWWMTFNEQTYSHSLLTLFGGMNAFAKRVRRYPLAADLAYRPDKIGGNGLDPKIEDLGMRDIRYPRVSVAEVEAANPAVILVPDEPFPFSGGHKMEIETLLGATDAVKNGRIIEVDGSLITWHGTRLALAIQKLPAAVAGL